MKYRLAGVAKLNDGSKVYKFVFDPSSISDKDGGKHCSLLQTHEPQCYGCAVCKALGRGRYWYTTNVFIAASIDSSRFDYAAELYKRSSSMESSLVVHGHGGLTLREFQARAVEEILERKKVILADEMGCGKTIEGIGALLETGISDALFIVPASLVTNWVKEIEKWAPHLSPVRLKRNDEYRGGVAVCSYSALSKRKKTKAQLNSKRVRELGEKYDRFDICSKPLSNNHKRFKYRNKPIDGRLALSLKGHGRIKFIMCDESHYLKNVASSRYQSTKEVIEENEIDYLVLATGTPISNRPKDIWTQLHLTAPGAAGKYTWFLKNFCTSSTSYFYQHGQRKSVKEFDGLKNANELNFILKATSLVRRTKDMVLSQLPEKIRRIVHVDADAVTNKASKSLVKAYDEMERWELSGDSKKAFKARVIVKEKRREFGERKAKFMIKYIQDVLESEEKVIIFVHHHSVGDIIKDELGDIAVQYNGRMSVKQKDNAMFEFQEGDKRVFIGSVGAAGVGLTLTASSTVIFAEMPWTHSEFLQAEDRAHRIGQKNAVDVHCPVVEGSIDGRIARRITDKAVQAFSVLDCDI